MQSKSSSLIDVDKLMKRVVLREFAPLHRMNSIYLFFYISTSPFKNGIQNVLMTTQICSKSTSATFIDKLSI